MTVLSVENLLCGYKPGNPTLKNISFTVEEGDFVGVVGPNGSGKTTLLRVLVGLMEKEAGIIMLGGQQLEALERRELARRVAFVPQLMEPIEGFTVEELVLLGRTPYLDRFAFEKEDDHEAVAWAITELKVEDLKGRAITELSGGEFQRVAIARALAQEPRILLLDEPTSHLDIRYQMNICKLLKKLRSHRSIVATFHDLNLAARFCSKLLLLKGGELIAQGTPDEVVTPENIWKAYRVKVSVKKPAGTKKAKYILLP